MRQTIELPAQPDNDTAQRMALSGPNTRWLRPLAGENHEPPAALLAPVQNVPVIYDPAFASHENSGSEEYATPTGRAWGQAIRLLPFSVVWLFLGIGVVWVLGMSWPWLLIWWGALTAATYYTMDTNEFRHSRNGVEHAKISAALTVRLREMENNHELRRMALHGYLKSLGVNDD